MIDSCNIYGAFLYGEKVYAPPECYINEYEFLVSVYDYTTLQLLTGVNWELYKRNQAISLTGLVDESHTLVDSGISSTGHIMISLLDYDLRTSNDDFYLKTWIIATDNKYVSRLRIKYFASEYISNDNNWPYVRETLQIDKATETIIETGGGGGGGGGLGGGSVITHTEYKDKPLPKIKVMAVKDDESKEDKEIWVVNIKDFDSL